MLAFILLAGLTAAQPPPDLGQAPPAGAIVLFDGADTSAWAQDAGMRIRPAAQRTQPCHWRIVDGALEVTKGGHLVTRRDFTDVRVHLELRVPPEEPVARVNSGVWFAFRYGIEIRAPGQWEIDPKYATGSLYATTAPSRRADRPAGEWQSLDIVFRNARFDAAGAKTANCRFTVVLNGVTVQDGAEYPRTAPTLREPEGPGGGPLVLENHGSAVRYRSIWAVDLAQGGAP